MKAFAYERASDAAAAVAAGADGATFLGGGTNLVDLMKLGVAEPQRLVDVVAAPVRHGRGDRATGCASAPPSATPTSPRTR